MKTRSLIWLLALVAAVVAATYFVMESQDDADIEIDLPEVEINQ